MAFVAPSAAGAVRFARSDFASGRCPAQRTMRARSSRSRATIFSMADADGGTAGESAKPTEESAAAPAAAAEKPAVESKASAVQDAASDSEVVGSSDTAAKTSESISGDSGVAQSEEEQGSGTDDGAKKRRAGRRGGPRQKREVTLKLEDMTPGMEVEGVVKSTTAYGAFVGDIGAPTDGLLHVSQLSNGYVENVTDVVNVGDKIKARILNIDIEKGNFSLTIREPKADGEGEDASSRSRSQGRRGKSGGGAAAAESAKKWDEFTFDPKVFVEAKVISVADFGAFCKLLNEEGETLESAPTDGLVHISELSNERVEDVGSVLSVDQVVKVRVTNTDRKRNRISLSLKEYKADESETLAEDMAASQSNQPEFKTSFELAFEKAKAKEAATSGSS